MDKLKKLCKALSLICKKPYLLNLVLESEPVMKEKLKNRYGMEDGFPVVDIDWFTGKFQGVAAPYAYLSGATTPIDIALLRILALRYHVERYFEIGTWRGESVANMAQVVPHCTTFNLPKEEIVRLTHDERYADLHGFFSRKMENVEHLTGNSLTYDFSALYGRFDMVFVDGDHHYEAVKKDTETAFKLLKGNDKIIVWHDYALDPETVRWEVMAAILDGCPSEKRGHLYHVSNTLCAVYLPEGPPCRKLVPFEPPQRCFEVDIRSVSCEGD